MRAFHASGRAAGLVLSIILTAGGVGLAAPTPPAPAPGPSPAPAPAPSPLPKPAPAPAPGPSTAPAPAPAAAAEKKPDAKPHEPKPYKDVITAEAKSQPGLFKVHQVDDKYYFEIPPAMLGREMLWQTELEQVPTGYGYGGISAGSKVIRWTRHENKVYVRAVNHTIRAEGKGGIVQAVEDSSLEPILAAFDVEAEGQDKAPVINVTSFLMGDNFQAGQVIGAAGPDANRTYIDQIKAFPTNIESKILMTFGGGPAGPSAGPGRRSGGGGTPLSALVHYSLDLLPEVPMQGRLFDSRVGFFNEGFEEYGRPDHRVVERQYITRYRLEKKDPNAALSEPVKPIVYYLSREVPDRWRPYLKRGVEAWNVAFEAAGYKNAIICKDAPTVQEDPDWDPDDARYSVIRWAPSETENAMGPHVHDPRSGEIISAHIIIWHNVMKLAEDWYFVQCGALDKRAATIPLPDELMGEILQYIVCHEVGHTLGLQHNFKGSSAYHIAQLRSREFTARNGDEASIMDYGRFNYVAQPGDNAVLIPTIGPYDKFAIRWGYLPLPSRTTPDEEKVDLDLMAAQQVSDPQLRFGNSDPSDPTVETEDLSDDPIEATRLGMKNLARVSKMLVPATTKLGEDYDLLDEMFGRLLNQREMEMAHVSRLIGGVVETDYHAGRGSVVYMPTPGPRQRQAMQFLVENAFTTPKDVLNPDIFYRISPSGVADLVLSSQAPLMNSLLRTDRIDRMLDAQQRDPAHAYTVEQLVTDLQNGIWSELSAPKPEIDLYRRNLQREYLTMMKTTVAGGAEEGDLRPIAIDALRQLAHRIDGAVPHAHDQMTALHLLDCRKQIERILDPKAEVTVSAPMMFNPFMAAPGAVPQSESAIAAPGHEAWRQVSVPDTLPDPGDCTLF